MKKIQKLLLIILILIAVFIIINLKHLEDEYNDQQGNTKIDIKITTTKGEFILDLVPAKTLTERSLGLMNRNELTNSDGMIFIFDNEQIQSFWMKNTFISLDVIFFDQQGKFINQFQNTIPNQTSTIYQSNKPSKYVIELTAGRSIELGIDKESSIEIPQ